MDSRAYPKLQLGLYCTVSVDACFHHSSCPDTQAACDLNTYNGAGPSAHIFTGALVGGPDTNNNNRLSQQLCPQ